MFLCSLRYFLKCYFSKEVYSFTLSTVFARLFATFFNKFVFSLSYFYDTAYIPKLFSVLPVYL